MVELNNRERYMRDALYAIASFGRGQSATKVLRPYMDKHKIKWDKDEDVKKWMQRIANDAIAYVNNNP